MRASTPVLEAFAAEVGAEDPVVALGGGTAPEVGGSVERDAREVRAPAGVVEFEPAEMTVRVGAATPVEEVDRVLADAGQCVALPARPGSTVGGVLAVGRSGLRRLGWGPVRDAVLEIRAVGADGRLFTAGGPTVKNVSGYDLCRLLVGSLGTLAVFAEVVLRTRPLPAHEQLFETDRPGPEVLADLHRPLSVLWDGTTTWVLLAGHPADIESEASSAGLVPSDHGPDVPPHPWSLPPEAVAGLDPGDGPFVAEVGVGVVHRHVPQPPRPVAPPVAELHRRLKARFDPTGRLAPGRDVLSS